MFLLGRGNLVRGPPRLRQRRSAGPRGQEVPRLAVGFRHPAGPAACDDAVQNELHELQHVAAGAATVAVPALLIEPNVKRAMRLAAVVWAIAVQGLRGLLCDAFAEEFAGDLANLQIRHLPVVRVHVYRRRAHGRASSRKERNVFRRSTWRLATQFSMPHRSPRRMTDSLARVTAV
jgi:hypothetical protein